MATVLVKYYNRVQRARRLIGTIDSILFSAEIDNTYHSWARAGQRLAKIRPKIKRFMKDTRNAP